MANMIENRAINANIELASVAITYDGTTAGSPFVSTVMIPAGATVVGVYINTSAAFGAALAGTGALRVAVGAPNAWITGAIAAASCKAGVVVPTSANASGAIHVNATGTVSVAGVHYISVGYVQGNA